MSIIRQDPTTREWVIVAPARGRRPHAARAPDDRRGPSGRQASCPFCPGSESETPEEIWRIPAKVGDGWAVRVVPNKFPALTPVGSPVRREIDSLFREMDGAGHHEVIVETPVHDRVPSQMDDGEIAAILEAHRARYRALESDPCVKCIVIFKNHGETAGTSLEHPHSQLVATPVAPASVRRKYEVAVAHYDDTGRCLYCDLVESELAARARVVLETEHFVVFHPFASRVPFETWIAPRCHRPAFGQASDEEIRGLAPVLRASLDALDRALGRPDFNYIVHSAPTEDATKQYYLWHLQILPRVTTIAGFELGSGIYITTMLPEDSAAVMRRAIHGACPRPGRVSA